MKYPYYGTKEYREMLEDRRRDFGFEPEVIDDPRSVVCARCGGSGFVQWVIPGECNEGVGCPDCNPDEEDR